MGWKTNPPGCSTSNCGCLTCIWSTANESNHNQFDLVRDDEIIEDFDWNFASGDILQTAEQSPFVRQGQILLDVTFDIPAATGLTFDTGTGTTDSLIRVYCESDGERDNYVFVDVRIKKLGWRLVQDELVFNDGNASRASSSPGPGDIAYIIEIGRRTSGTDVISNRNVTYLRAATTSSSQRLLIALSRHECDFVDELLSPNDTGGFCFDGYSAVLLRDNPTQTLANVNLAIPNPSGDRFDRLTAFHPIRTSIPSAGVGEAQRNVGAGLDPGVGFSEELTEPSGTYAGIEYLASSPVDATVNYVAVGKYEKGYRGTRDFQTIGATETRYASPVVSISGTGATYVDTGSFETQLTPADEFFAATIYGRIVYDPMASPSLVVTYSDSPSFPAGGHESDIFKISTPPSPGTYDFEFQLTAYEGLFHNCLTWPIGYLSPCQETGFLISSPSVINSSGTSSFEPLGVVGSEEFADGKVAALGNFIAKHVVDGGYMSQVIADVTPAPDPGPTPDPIPIEDPPPLETFSRAIFSYNLSSLMFLSKDSDYLQPTKVQWFRDITYAMEVWSNSNPVGASEFLEWDFANKLFVPKQPGESGHLLVWVEVFESARVQEGDGTSFETVSFWNTVGERNRYYGLFAAAPVSGDNLTCDGLTIEVLETSKKAFYEKTTGSVSLLTSLDLEKVVLNFDAI